MTVCFKLARTLRQHSRVDSEHHCAPCVYFSKNLDQNEYPHQMERVECCGLGFLPGDSGCAEMRADNCSTRKK